MPKQDKQQPLINFLMNKFSYSVISIIKHRSDLLHDDNKSSQNLLLIMKDNFEFKNFYKELEADKKAHKSFRSTDILIMRQKEITDSCDIFPIEYLEITDSEEAIVGKKLADLVKIKNTNLRLQIESNIRRNSILLKNAFVYNKKDVVSILEGSLNNFVVSLKNLLRLHDVPVGRMSARDILVKTADIIEFDIQLFFLLMRVMENPKTIKLNKLDIDDIFCSYLAQIDNIAAYVDKLDLSQKNASVKKAPTKKPASKKNEKESK